MTEKDDIYTNPTYLSERVAAGARRTQPNLKINKSLPNIRQFRFEKITRVGLFSKNGRGPFRSLNLPFSQHPFRTVETP